MSEAGVQIMERQTLLSCSRVAHNSTFLSRDPIRILPINARLLNKRRLYMYHGSRAARLGSKNYHSYGKCMSRQPNNVIARAVRDAVSTDRTTTIIQGIDHCSTGRKGRTLGLLARFSLRPVFLPNWRGPICAPCKTKMTFQCRWKAFDA